MGPKEYYVDGFQVLADRVMIGGVKRKGRKRSVPRVRVGLFMVAASASDVGVTREKRRFGERLKGLGLRPYDLRRTYANMLEAAGIPRTRRMLYMGHGKRDVTDLYEHHEVTAFLGEDAERLERYLAATEKKTLELVK
ncbi:MAG TPA: hypothetical protein VNM48_00265, partial [Chloroflexota bacterium]|nr:hypothetical protein [Chloroflexota bacterium]